MTILFDYLVCILIIKHCTYWVTHRSHQKRSQANWTENSPVAESFRWKTRRRWPEIFGKQKQIGLHNGSGTVFFRFVFFWICFSARFSCYLLVFFWNWKLPLQLYLPHNFGAQTFHVAWYFATRVHLRYLRLVYGCFGVGCRIGLGSRSEEAKKQRNIKAEKQGKAENQKTQ